MRRLTSIIGIVAAVALIAACNGGDNGAAPDETAPGETGSTAEITISGFVFGGADSVRVGDTVVITNADGVPHTWTEVDRAFDSGALGTDETFEYTFDEAGVFDYFCSIHPEMTGTITVEA